MLALRNSLIRNVSARVLRPTLPITVTKKPLSYSKPLNQEVGEEYTATGTITRRPLKIRRVKRIDDSVAKVSRPAPFWEAKAVFEDEISPLSLNHFEKKFLVMIFYPLDFTFVCPTELTAFSDRIKEFKEINTEVVGISCDSEHTHYNWNKIPRNQGGLGNLKYPLVSDFSKRISEDYGVLCEDKSFPFRGTIIIDDKGIVRVININDTQIGRSVDEVLRLVQAIQFANQYGEVCPANWKKGDSTIIPDQEKARSYFSKLK
ncbi:1042_t:CDS:10 [Diversispora eburnea]|uniref:thioredoxin-dependent peroxiredoxin n=1 Tax=Diversispora eburnea TaxID=1213867 RepID=A0A9N9ALG5_9GLOM|nr:1042_t:CDS:10 [Diversispora eburnea]